MTDSDDADFQHLQATSSKLWLTTGRVIGQRFQLIFFDQVRLADIDSLNRSRKLSSGIRRRIRDNIDNIHSLYHVSKHGVLVSRLIESGVIFDVDKKLTRRAVDILRSGCAYSTAVVIVVVELRFDFGLVGVTLS